MIFDIEPPPPRAWLRAFAPTARYCMRTEVHVHALAVAAGVLLSFFPFLIVMISLCRYGFRWPAAVNAIFIALNDYFPGELGGFLKRNLVAVVESRGPPGHGCRWRSARRRYRFCPASRAHACSTSAT